MFYFPPNKTKTWVVWTVGFLFSSAAKRNFLLQCHMIENLKGFLSLEASSLILSVRGRRPTPLPKRVVLRLPLPAQVAFRDQGGLLRLGLSQSGPSRVILLAETGHPQRRGDVGTERLITVLHQQAPPPSLPPPQHTQYDENNLQRAAVQKVPNVSFFFFLEQQHPVEGHRPQAPPPLR